MMNSNCRVVLILCQIFKVILLETLITIPPIYVYINRINNRLVFKIKDGYILELQTPKIKKVFGSTKYLIEKIKIGENVQSHEVAEVVLVQCILVDNQYQ